MTLTRKGRAPARGALCVRLARRVADGGFQGRKSSVNHRGKSRGWALQQEKTRSYSCSRCGKEETIKKVPERDRWPGWWRCPCGGKFRWASPNRNAAMTRVWREEHAASKAQPGEAA